MHTKYFFLHFFDDVTFDFAVVVAKDIGNLRISSYGYIKENVTRKYNFALFCEHFAFVPSCLCCTTRALCAVLRSEEGLKFSFVILPRWKFDPMFDSKLYLVL